MRALTNLCDALMQLKTILCELGQICATRNALMQLTTNASYDGSVRLEMLLSSWKQFYASLDRSVQQEML